MFSKPQFTNKEIANLHQAYLEAVYEVYYCFRYSDRNKAYAKRGLESTDVASQRRECLQTIRLFIDRFNPELDLILKKYNCTTWTLITAFNPYSQHLSAAENLLRHQSLIEYLEPLNLNILNAVGRDKDGIWTPEQSIFVMEIELENAIAIGNKFQQNAIVFGELGTLGKLLWL
ncbi:MAG: DUF3293 domain-containing protein [Pleurocapsa sp.]